MHETSESGFSTSFNPINSPSIIMANPGGLFLMMKISHRAFNSSFQNMQSVGISRQLMLWKL